MPFIVRWPGRAPAGLKNDATVLTAVDLLPTFCAIAGINPPEAIDGENLLPALKGEAARRTRPIFWRISGNKREADYWPDLAVREGDWKLVTTFDGKRSELYNLPANRAEDVAKNQAKEHPQVVARLTRLALEWNATLPTKADPACSATPR